MTLTRSLSYRTEGIDVLAPQRYRHMDGAIADLWSAEGHAGGGGYYLSANPRIIVFFDDVDIIQVASDERALGPGRRMGRAVYVPAGVPMWSRFAASGRFRHLDLYLDARRVRGMLVPQIGGSAAGAALKTPVTLARSDAVETLARLAADEVARQAHPDIYLQGLVQGIVGAMLAIPQTAPSAGLPEARMRHLHRHVAQNIHRRVTNAELAEVAGLSESRFAHVFKETTGETPQQWQARLRVDSARDLLCAAEGSLCDIASRLGFADQAHLTRAFRAATGTTPGAWRRRHAAGG